jgi:hypothetical protein
VLDVSLEGNERIANHAPRRRQTLTASLRLLICTADAWPSSPLIPGAAGIAVELLSALIFGACWHTF